MRRHCVGLARPQDEETVNTLRIDSYRRAAEFKLLLPELLRWDARSPDHVVLAGWDEEGRLVSTFQGIAAESAATAEQILGVSVEMEASCFPSIALGRAATLSGHGRTGLNSVLRWHFLDATIAAGFRSTMGLAYTGAPRVNTLFAMGYEFLRPKQVWDPEVEPIAPPLVVFLRANAFGKARELLRSNAGEAIAAYPWSGPALTLSTGKAG